MKKNLFAIAAGLISALALTSKVNAQAFDEIASAASITNYPKVADVGTVDNPNVLELSMVNTKALKDFNKNYKVTDEKWTKGVDCINATYASDGITYTVYYDKKGHWIGNLKTYNEDKMSRDIRDIVKQEYYDYKISGVQEIETFQNISMPVYLVTIQGDKDIKQLMIYDDQMSVYKQFKIN